MSIPSARPEGPARRILLIDDDRALREMAGEFLRSLGYDVEDVGGLEQARARVRARRFDLVLSDLVLEHGTGLDLLAEIKRDAIPCEVMIMTGHGGIDAAVEAIRHGAYDFVTKPLSLTRLELSVAKAIEKRRLEEDIERLSRGTRQGFGRLAGVSQAMRPVVSLLERVAASDSNLLVLGESGTGKEVAAREVHAHSSRSGGPFVAVHCGALPAELLESELFGHVRGAFTGAERNHRGFFSAADGGTLFLDEVGTAPPRVQVGLLRVLQERRVRPVGAESDVEVDVRIIAATNADLEEAMAAGTFRQDLYYRLATFVATMPPLRDRREDLPLLAGQLLEEIAQRTGRQVTLSPRGMQRLAGCDWPGNVRELQHVLEQAALLTDGPVLREQDLPLEPSEAEDRTLTLEELEREHIAQVLKRCAGNKLKAARALGIPRANLYRKIERYGLEEPAVTPQPAVETGRPEPPARRPVGQPSLF